MVGMIEMQTYEGVCQYCGEIRPVMAADQTDANHKITADCACGGAQKAEQKRKLLANIEQIAGDGASQMGFAAVDENLRRWLEAAGNLVLDDQIDKAAIQIGTTKIEIAINAKGQCKIKRSLVRTAALEA